MRQRLVRGLLGRRFSTQRPTSSPMTNYWLMKAEPESRIVKGKEVKFSVDDFEACQTTAWEGVRNHEAKNIMRRDMKVGDKVFFYHSNCKTPGIAATAEISKEAFPDHTANDPAHPYYDPKSASRAADVEPTWWMVELTLEARLKHFVPLSLLRQIGGCDTIEQVAELDFSSSEDNPSSLMYLASEDLVALKKLPLLNRGRLSVQPVNAGAWIAINKMAEKGGWTDSPGLKRPARKPNPANKPTKRKRAATGEEKNTLAHEDVDDRSKTARRSKRIRR